MIRGLGRVAPPAHHRGRRPVRVARSPAARFRPLVGAPPRGDDQLPAPPRRGRRHRRGPRHRSTRRSPWGCPAADADAVLRCLRDLGFALGHPALSDEAGLLQGLEEFRQHLGGRLTLTMLRGVGDPVDVHEIDPGRMHQALERLKAFAPTTPDGNTEPDATRPLATSPRPAATRRR